MLPRPFFVQLYFESPQEETLRIPPHRLIIEPLVAAADEICVFEDPEVALTVPLPPRIEVQPGVYRLDLQQELVRGWERFWNTGGFKRGAITIRLPRDSIDWVELFQWTQYGGIWSSRRQIEKGTPAAAVTYCVKNSLGSSVVASLSASNGLREMDLYFDRTCCEQFHALAQASCRHFVHKWEVGKFPREIVYNVPEYRELV